MTAPIVNKVCPHCKNPLDSYVEQLHPRSTRTPSTVGTCRTPDCPYFEVTLAHENWDKLATDEAMQAKYMWLAKAGA